MKKRCDNPNDPAYANYGGRGITYCPSWEKFENFQADMGKRPEGKTLDRIDNDKGYCKENCKWSTSQEQRANQRKQTGPRTDSSTGVRGVSFISTRNVYQVTGRINGKSVHLYQGPSLEAAIAARQKWESEQ